VLEVPTCLLLASKVFCKSLFSGERRAKLRLLERAKHEIDTTLDIKQIMRSQLMTRILSECLLSAQSWQLAQLNTSTRVLNQTESSEKEDEKPDQKLAKLEGWQPTKKQDQLILNKFVQRQQKDKN